MKDALDKAWKTTPSKNNSMPYQVLVWGPDKKVHKEAIHNLVTKSHRSTEEKAVEAALIEQSGHHGATYYEHIAFMDHLITIHSRVSTPNKFYLEQVKRGHFYDQGYEHMFEKIIDSVSVEVGHFSSNLGYYLLEEGLDISYNSCFKREVKDWHKVGLDMVKARPIAMISCGYAKRYRRQDLIDTGKEKFDIKPEHKRYSKMDIDLQLFKNIMAESRHNNDLLDSFSPNQFKSKERLIKSH